jgi:hypothetical protein
MPPSAQRGWLGATPRHYEEVRELSTDNTTLAPGAGPETAPDLAGELYDPAQSPVTPTVGRDVHHVARGSADGHYAPEIRPAKITRVHDGHDDGTPTVSLVVWTDEGQFWPKAVSYHGGVPDVEPNFSPYYRCPITGLAYPGGSWHWPPRV